MRPPARQRGGAAARCRRAARAGRRSARSADPVLGRPPPPLLDDPPALPDEQAARVAAARRPTKAVRGGRGPQSVNTSSMPARSGRALHLAGGEQRLGLGPEDERAVTEQRVVQRAHAEAVANQREPPPSGLPPGERELAVEAVERGEALALEQPQHHLGVAGGLERLAAAPRARPGARCGCRPRRCRRAGRRRHPESSGCHPHGQVDDRQPGRDQARRPASSASP